jgi:DNA-directed RNA polymerase specialized sigma24 family protein
MRRRLVGYFARKRVRAPDELADETMSRVSRRLEEEPSVGDTPPPRYCFIVAKFVFLEYLRQHDAAPHVALDPAATHRGEDAERERLLECLDRCLAQLRTEERSLILDYYSGDMGQKIGARRELAARLGVSANALAIRACRIRDKLEGCVAACARTMKS